MTVILAALGFIAGGVVYHNIEAIDRFVNELLEELGFTLD